MLGILAVILAAFSLALPSPAYAADTTDVTIMVIDDESKERVPDITIEVMGEGFTADPVTTDDKGMATVTVPANATYTFTADEASLPDGAPGFVTNPVEMEIKGIPTTVRFDIGEAQAADETASAAPSETADDAATDTTTTDSASEGGVSGGNSFMDQLMQKIVSGLIFGLILALASIGVSLIYGTTGLNNFAHGEMVTFGGLISLTAITVFSVNEWVGLILAIIFGAVFGWVQDLGIWKPLRKKGVGLIPIMIVSIGLSLFLRYLYAFIWGPERLTMPQSYAAVVSILGVGLTKWNLISAIVSIVLIVLVALALTYTKLGKATRAVADNKPLAAASGINVDRVIRIVWIGSGALAAVSGVLVAYYQTLNFMSGASILLLIFAAVTLGGLGTTYGALFGSLILSLFIELSTFVIPTSLKYVVAMLVMILILLVRPQGLLGKKQRIG